MTIENSQTEEDRLVNIFTSIRTGGLPKEQYEKMKDRSVGQGFSVEEFVKSEIEFGQLKWQKEKLVFDWSNLPVKLDEDTEEVLRKRSLETGLGPRELMLQFVKEGLGIQDMQKVS